MNTQLQTAITLHQSGDLEQAESIYLSLLEAEPENIDLLHLLAILNAQKHQFKAALCFIQEAIRLDPKSPAFYNSLGNIYKNQKQWDKAIEAYYQAIELNPSNSTALNNLGNLLYAQGKWVDAIQHYQTALKFKPDSADTYCNLGLAFKMQGNPENAKSAFMKSITLDPKHASSQMELGRIAQNEGKIEEAITHYQACLQTDPHHLEARNNLGTLWLSQDKPEAAIDCFKTVLSLNPNHLESLINLGCTYLKCQQLNEALSCYLQLLQIHPDFDTYYNIGVIYMHKEHHESAIQYFHEALKLNPEDLSTQMNLGSIYLKMENYPLAIQHYKAALKLSPNHPEIRYLIAALTQDNPLFKSAPSDYIQSLFDQYAPYFDAHLKNYLHYQSPQALFKAVTQYAGVKKAKWHIVDLGCGTGLCGTCFRPLAEHLVGIDLSPKMIEIAQQKGCYDLLKTEAIETALSAFRQIDLIIAADVFTYLGDLKNIFKLSFQALKKKGLFAFTTEKSDSADYHLQHSARFAHHPHYIEALAREIGFNIVCSENTVLREQKHQPLEGCLWLLEKTDKDEST